MMRVGTGHRRCRSRRWGGEVRLDRNLDLGRGIEGDDEGLLNVRTGG